jgi:hypothetical protein
MTKSIAVSALIKATDKAQHAEATFSAIATYFAGDASVSSGKMFGSVGLKTNGKVFAMLVRHEFVVKLTKARVDELVRTNAGRYFDPGHGRLMKEWVSVSVGNVPWLTLAQEAHRLLTDHKP